MRETSSYRRQQNSRKRDPMPSAEDVRLETYGQEFTCSRCREHVSCVFGSSFESSLTAMGWHKLGDKRFCSKLCVEWHAFHASRPENAPVQAVDQIADRAYAKLRGKK